MAEDPEEIQQEQPLLKSLNSNLISFVVFHSRIKRPVELLWVNYEGNVENYITMNYGDEYKIDTFVTHPWIAWDAQTRQRYLLNHKTVYFPSPFDPDYPLENVTIDMPVYSLRERGLQTLWSCVSENDMDKLELELPRCLHYDLKNRPPPEFQYQNDN